MERKIQEGIVYWKNTTTAFKSQHTQSKNMIAQLTAELREGLEAHNLPRKRYLDCEGMSKSIRAKFAILEGYLTKISDMATIAPETEEDTVEGRLRVENEFQSQVGATNALYGEAEGDLEVFEKRMRMETGEEVQRNVVLPRGTATTLKPDLLTS